MVNWDWELIRRKAKELGADGCSGVPDFHVDCCLHHDIMYRTGMDVNGKEVTRAEADAEFRRCHQERSRFGKASPMAFWRWVGVRLFGGSAWKGKL